MWGHQCATWLKSAGLPQLFLHLQVSILRMDREGRAIAYQFSFKPVLFSKLASSESESWHWIFIEWLSAFGVIEIINKYIITWFNKDFLFNTYQEPYICKGNFKIIHTHDHHRADSQELPSLKVSGIKTFLNRPNNPILDHDYNIELYSFWHLP